MSSIFRAYDIRGVFGEELDEGVAYLIGRAIATFTGAKRIMVGHDMRTSSPCLRDALIRGIQDQGADVVSIGLCSTPMFYWAAQQFSAGVMVTASHNPAKYNGFKICRDGATPVGEGSGMEEIARLVESAAFSQPDARGKYEEQELLDAFIESNLSLLNTKKPFKIVVDAGNGMGGYTYEALMRLAPESIEIVPMFFELDGTFPNHDANPIDESTLEQLKTKVRKEGAQIGVGLDGDADRVVFLDEEGTYIPSDVMTAIIAGQILTEHPGGTVLYDVRSSWVVKEEIEKAGGVAVPTRIGHALIKMHMKESGAVFAGELSGHFYNKEQQNTENTQILLFKLLNLLSETELPLSKIARPLLERYAKIPETNFSIEDPSRAIAYFEKKFSHQEEVVATSHIDGIRVEFKDWWFNLRASNTEPVLRLNMEAKTKELLDTHLEELRRELAAQ